MHVKKLPRLHSLSNDPFHFEESSEVENLSHAHGDQHDRLHNGQLAQAIVGRLGESAMMLFPRVPASKNTHTFI